MVEIIFLGTGSSLDNLTRRNAGGFVLKTESEQIHFDPGPGAVAAAQAFNVNLKNTDAVIISRNDSIRNNEQNLISQLSDKQTLMINQESKRLNKIGTTKTERTDYGYKIIAKNFTLLYLFKPLTKETIKKDKLNADVLILNNNKRNKEKVEKKAMTNALYKPILARTVPLKIKGKPISPPPRTAVLTRGLFLPFPFST